MQSRCLPICVPSKPATYAVPSAIVIPCGTSHSFAPGTQRPAHIACWLANGASCTAPYGGRWPRTSAYVTGPHPVSCLKSDAVRTVVQPLASSTATRPTTRIRTPVTRPTLRGKVLLRGPTRPRT